MPSFLGRFRLINIMTKEEESELEEAWIDKRRERQREAMQTLRESMREWAKQALTETKTNEK